MRIESESHTAAVEPVLDRDNDCPSPDLFDLQDLDRARRWSVIDMYGVATLGFLTVALLPGFFFPTNLRHAVALSVVPVGTWLIAQQLRSDGRAPAGFAVALICIAIVTAVTGDTVTSSLFGTTTLEMSSVALLAAFGWWAVGRYFSATARRVLPVVLTAGALVNIALGAYQVALAPATGMYRSFEGRLSGLMSNPVFFASTFIGVWAYWFVRARRTSSFKQLVLLGVLATSLGLSGSRASMLIVVMLTGVAVIVRPPSMRRVLALASTSIAGMVIGTVVLNLLADVQSKRYTTPSGGLALRFEVWRTTLSAWVERPLFGWGPDPYLHEVNSRFSKESVAEYGPLQWPDPHNVVLLVLVSFGVAGLILVAGFVVTGLRGRIDMALLAAAAAMALSWMLQPVTVATWPIAFALFGAAVGPVSGETRLEPQLNGRMSHALVAIGVVITGALSIWSLQFTSSLSDPDPRAVEDRAGWFIHEPAVAARVATEYHEAALEGRDPEVNFARAEQLSREAIEQSHRTRYWTQLTEIKISQSDYRGAMEVIEQWVTDWPNDPTGYRYMGAVSEILSDDGARERALAALCEIEDLCARPPTP